MSLPRGYTELEYIQSSGTQYINTGFAPNQNTRVVADVQFVSENNSQFVFGVRKLPGASVNFGFLINSTQFRSDYGDSSKVHITVSSLKARILIDKNKNKCYIDNVLKATNTASTFQSEYNLYLFASNDSGEASYFGSLRMYSCKVYDNGTLIRDYIPAKNAGGTVGLYDAVNGIFYQNSGSGTFARGAEIYRGPAVPENLKAEVMGTDVTLSWSASDGAVGYRIYHGMTLIADTDETQYRLTGFEKYTAHTYYVSAYDEEDEGAAASVSFFVNGNGRPLSDLITDRTAADVTMRTKKGSYNASDMNRVLVSAEYVRQLIRALGYTLPDGNNRYMSENDIPDTDQTAAYLEDISGIDVIGYSQNKLILPVTLSHLTYEGANTIEKFLKMIGEAAERIPEAYIYSDEIYGGENY